MGTEPQQILEAINDRAITRLVVEDGAPREPALEAEDLAGARSRIVSCLAYSSSGRVTDPDVRIASNPVTEGYVKTVLERSDEVEPATRSEIEVARRELVEDGVAVETYRRIDVNEALSLLAG